MVPAAGDSTSLVDLSLSSVKMGWPSATAVPSATSHSDKTPSVMEKPILGRMISVAIKLLLSSAGQGFSPAACLNKQPAWNNPCLYLHLSSTPAWLFAAARLAFAVIFRESPLPRRRYRQC